MTELFREHDGIDGKRLVQPEVVGPIYGLDSLIDIVGTERLEALDGFQDTDSGVQLEIGAIHHFLVTSEGNHTATGLYVVGAQLHQFFCQDGFQAHKGLGNQFKLLCHYVML